MPKNLEKEIKQAERKCNTLKQTNQTGTKQYTYWLNRLHSLKMLRWQKYRQILEHEHGPITLERRIIASGASQVTAYTQAGRFIQHIPLKLIPNLGGLPVKKDFRDNNPSCERCGEFGTELHHWAPQHLFEDAWQWPTSYLCKLCHDEWHLTIQNHKKYRKTKESKNE